MLNPIQLRTLSVVLRTGSFAEAARHLGYTGSAVSQQISALERQLGTTLFERDAHSIRAMPAAEFIAARSSAALGALEALADDIGLLTRGAVGRLRVGSFATASERLLPDALSSFQSSHPRVEVHLDEAEPDELVSLLESREIDVALLYRYDLMPKAWPRAIVTQRAVREDLLVVRAGKPGGGRAGLDLGDLAGETWISTRHGTAGSAVLHHVCRAAGFEPQVSYRSNSYGLIQGLVRARLGIALVPALGFQPGPGVSATRIRGSDACRELVVASPPTSPPALVGSFTDAVRRAARRLGSDGVVVVDPP